MCALKIPANRENLNNFLNRLKVILDADLAEIYGYSTSRFNEQVKYNVDRFDEDFRFQFKKEELSGLISEFPTSKRGGTRKMPYAFSEQGIYMHANRALGGVPPAD